jgi:hypothetical protein
MIRTVSDLIQELKDLDSDAQVRMALFDERGRPPQGCRLTDVGICSDGIVYIGAVAQENYLPPAR